MIRTGEVVCQYCSTTLGVAREQIPEKFNLCLTVDVVVPTLSDKPDW